MRVVLLRFCNTSALGNGNLDFKVQVLYLTF